jgi:hypothetical protein
MLPEGARSYRPRDQIETGAFKGSRQGQGRSFPLRLHVRRLMIGLNVLVWRNASWWCSDLSVIFASPSDLVREPCRGPRLRGALQTFYNRGCASTGSSQSLHRASSSHVQGLETLRLSERSNLTPLPDPDHLSDTFLAGLGLANKDAGGIPCLGMHINFQQPRRLLTGDTKQPRRIRNP